MILIAASNKDAASLNISKQVLNNYNFKSTAENFQGNKIFEAEVCGENVKLLTMNEELVHAQNITNFFKAIKLVVFISRHSSISGTPTLSVHTPGNLGEAKLGGLPRSLSISPAKTMKECLKAMARLKDEMHLNYEVYYECTHHGPSLSVPTMFAELGSSPKQWSDQKAAEAVAHATMEAVSNFGKIEARVVLGIGGPHYNMKFTRMALESDIAFGHIIPKYAIPYIDEEIVKQCIEKTLEKVNFAVLDWKGIKGENKAALIKMFENTGLPIQKV
ncbi:MAG: D-aminoacyl-tRNA deacylase [Candidatus Bathycorpusculaceae bacterium]